MVAQSSPAEELPALYRATLDLVGALERCGQRTAATAIRRDAIAAYSAAWDDHQRGVLIGLVERGRKELGRGSPQRVSLPAGRPAFPAAGGR